MSSRSRTRTTSSARPLSRTPAPPKSSGCWKRNCARSRMARTSVLIPSRHEEYLVPTVVDALKQARGDVEVIAILDGWWPNPGLPDDKRVKILHWGIAQGLRPSLNAAGQ